jgi:hypothetical protein
MAQPDKLELDADLRRMDRHDISVKNHRLHHSRLVVDLYAVSRKVRALRGRLAHRMELIATHSHPAAFH